MADLVDDAAGDLFEEGVWDFGNFGGEVVVGDDGAEDEHVFHGDDIAFGADEGLVAEDGEKLADFLAEVGLVEFFFEDSVGVLDKGNLVGCDLAEDADGMANTGEGLLPNVVVWTF